MKHLWFGLVTACAATTPRPAHPLCGSDGAPACGNIGQVGRATATKPAPRPTRPAPTEAAKPAVMMRVVLRASAENTSTQPVARPLVDRDERPMNGNGMGKRMPREKD